MAKNLVNGTNIIIEENGDNINMNLSSDYNTALATQINTALQNYFECKILWTNPSPTSSFGTNTIILSSNDYDFLEFICIYVSSNIDITFSQKTIKGKGLVASAYHSSNNVTRIFDYTDETHYTSRHGFLGTSQDDTRVVPLYVIGYKTGTF